MKNKKKLIFNLCILSAGFILASCGGNNNPPTSSEEPVSEQTSISEENSSEQTSVSEGIVLKFKSAVLSSTENEGELKIKAEINGTEGKIYYVLSDEEKELTGEEIVSGEGFDVKGSSESTYLEEFIRDLEPGKMYYAYFVIKHNDSYSAIQKKSATTYKNAVDMGEGTPENPFKVFSIEDLEHVGLGVYDAYNLDWSKTSCYQLQNNIDLSTKYGENLASWIPLSLNTDGVFDGNGFEVSNMYINEPSSTVNLGLFQQVNLGATVKNLTLSNVTIISNGYNDKPRLEDLSTSVDSYTAGGIYVGAVSGDIKGTVENCHVKNASITVSGGRVGGIAGRLYSDNETKSTIRNCSVDSQTTIKGYSRLGGIVGLVDAKSSAVFEQPVIENVRFDGTIEGTSYSFEYDDGASKTNVTVVAEYIGGIAGYYRSATIKNAVSTGTIKGYRHVGGIVGFQQYNNKVPNNNTTIDGALFTGSLTIESGTNVGPIVGNRSTSNTTEADVETKVQLTNAYYSDSAKMYVVEDEISFDSLNKNAKFGELVTLSEDWYSDHLTTFDFEKVWTLDANFVPTFKK